MFENISSELLSFSQFMLTVFASNILGDSLTSSPLFIGMHVVSNLYIQLRLYTIYLPLIHPTNRRDYKQISSSYI